MTHNAHSMPISEQEIPEELASVVAWHLVQTWLEGQPMQATTDLLVAPLICDSTRTTAMPNANNATAGVPGVLSTTESS